MVDIQSPQSSALSLSSSNQVAASTTPGLNAISVSVTALSQALQNLTRSIQTTATPVAAPSGNILTLATALGNVSVTLPQLAITEQQTLLQQILSMVQSQRPLTLALQAGSPPTQAVLLVPTAAGPNIQTSVPRLIDAPVLPILSLTNGEALPALVLPSTPSVAIAATGQGTVIPQLSNGESPGLTLQQSLTPALPTPQIPQGAVDSLSPLQNIRSMPPYATPPLPLELQPSSNNTLIPNQSLSLPSLSSSPLVMSPLPSETAPSVSTSPVSNVPSSASDYGPVPSSIANFLSPGTDIVLRINAIYPPVSSAASGLVEFATLTLPPLAPNQIQAVVIGSGTDGQIILKSAATTFFVKAQVSAQIGTNLVLTIEPARPPALVTLPLLEPLSLPSLPQIVSALAQIDPQLVQQVMMTRVPQPSEALPGTLLLLFSAFKENGLRGWLGNDVVDRLNQIGKQNLITSLSREMSDASVSTQDPIVGQWHSYPLPLFAENQFQSLMLYVHNEQKHADQKSSGSGLNNNKVRFLIDMKLSQLGAMQIDGFVQTKKLDMILRSENLLPEGLHQSLRLSYIKALDSVGYVGTLTFQVGRHHWLVMEKPSTVGILT